MPGAIYTNLQRHAGGRGSGTVPCELIKTPGAGRGHFGAVGHLTPAGRDRRPVLHRRQRDRDDRPPLVLAIAASAYGHAVFLAEGVLGDLADPLEAAEREAAIAASALIARYAE